MVPLKNVSAAEKFLGSIAIWSLGLICFLVCLSKIYLKLYLPQTEKPRSVYLFFRYLNIYCQKK